MRFAIPVAFAVIALLFGCPGNNDDLGNDNLYPYKGITVSKDEIPQECEGLEDCDMFACMVSQCWCKETAPEGGIVFHSTNKANDEADAVSIAEEYLISENLDYDESSLGAVKLNGLFYNVFYEIEGDEQVLTIAIDGTIMETVCGV